MGIAAGASAALGVAGGAINYFEGKKRKEAAEKALSQFERQELTNVHEGRQVSTMGADLLREENSRAVASGVQALRESGTRGLIGGLGRIQQQNNKLNRGIAANLDEQRKGIDRDIAQDNTRIQGVQENRDNQELAGIGAELEAGRQTQANGLSAAISSVQGALLPQGGGGGLTDMLGKGGKSGFKDLSGNASSEGASTYTTNYGLS